MGRANHQTQSAMAMRKPMAGARRVSLFEREIRIKLSGPAIEILFDLGAVISEGQLEQEGYFGSTMITIDISRATGVVSDACDARTARRVADLLSSDSRVRARAKRVAVAEAEARAGCKLRSPQVDMSVRSTGSQVHIDIDVEAARARATRG